MSRQPVTVEAVDQRLGVVEEDLDDTMKTVERHDRSLVSLTGLNGGDPGRVGRLEGDVLGLRKDVDATKLTLAKIVGAAAVGGLGGGGAIAAILKLVGS